jgi:protocatechuate 3,4-dioxygenase beta subunit
VTARGVLGAVGCMLLGAAMPVAAQTVTGSVVASDGTTVPGAIVVLLDESGHTRGTVLADDRGRFRVAAPGPGRYRVRVDRVAFASTIGAPFDASIGETVTQRLVLREEARRLDEVVVSGRTKCEVRPDSASALLAVWEEARKALVTVSLTEQAKRYPMTLALIERTYAPDGRTLTGQTMTTRSGVSNRPFVAPPAARLAQVGYVERSGEYWTFYAPDAQVILSDEFLGAHCLRLREPERKDSLHRGRIGLGFAPAQKGRITDIEGTLWLDRSSGELAALEYRYTRMPGGLDHESTGGRLEFRRLPSGAWIVQRWAIRMPMAGTEARTVAAVAATSSERSQRFDERLVTVLAGIKEDGGEVMQVEVAPGVSWSADGGRIRGSVIDGTTNRPLAEAAVYARGTAYFALTRPDGTFELRDLPRGTYTLGVRHPRLDSLALAGPVASASLETPGAVAQVRLAVPTAAEQLVTACGDSIPDDRRTLVRGVVRERGSGAPLADAMIHVTGLQQTEGIVTTAAGRGRTDAAGRFALCGLPPRAPITLEIEASGIGAAQRVVTPEAGRVVVVPVRLPERDED